MKMSRTCSGRLSSAKDDFKFLKIANTHKMHVHHGHHSSKGRVTVLSLQISLSLNRNMNVTVAKKLYHYLLSIRLVRTKYPASMIIYYDIHNNCLDA